MKSMETHCTCRERQDKLMKGNELKHKNNCIPQDEWIWKPRSRHYSSSSVNVGLHEPQCREPLGQNSSVLFHTWVMSCIRPIPPALLGLVNGSALVGSPPSMQLPGISVVSLFAGRCSPRGASSTPSPWCPDVAWSTGPQFPQPDLQHSLPHWNTTQHTVAFSEIEINIYFNSNSFR